MHTACLSVLDTYFKQYFWTFHLLVLGVGAVLVAKTSNAFVGKWLAPNPEELARPRAAGPSGQDRAKVVEAVPLTALLDRNVFRAAREDLKPAPEVAESAGPTQSFDPATCEPSTMSTTLLGTIVGTDATTSVAVFQDPSQEKTVVLRVDDKILEQATIKWIAQREVRVDHNGRCEVFSLYEQKPAPPQLANAMPPPPPPGPTGELELGQGVKQLSASEYEIPRGEIDRVLSNLNAIATQARIVPSFQNGQANGFKLFSIRPNSLYAKIGIQNGDVIQRINNFEMNSPDKALEIYSKLKDASSISVDILRRGKSQSLNYNIR